MPRRTWAPAAVYLFAAAALSVALFAGSDASVADYGVTEGLVAGASVPGVPPSGGGGEESPAEAQYPNEEEQDLPGPRSPGGSNVKGGPPQGEHPSPQVEENSPEASPYYDFYGRWLARAGDEPEVVEAKDAPSEGSVPGVQAPAKGISIMDPPTPYSQVVDNASPRRFFSGRGWTASPERAKPYGGDHEYIRSAEGSSPARFEVKIPAADHYAVYARWTAAERNNPEAHFRIETASGFKKVEVNQRKAGGVWVRLGAFEMEAGDRRSVRVSGRSDAEGRVIADAVMVVRGTQTTPHEGKDEAAGASVRGAKVVERARTHLGTPYRHSPPLPCQAYRSEDCSCLTRLVFGRWLTLPEDPVQQWQAGRSIERSNLLPGDLVFFKEAGEANPITHVAIYSGGGNVIHASSYWGRVVERPMKYVSGYYGARRPG